MIRADRTVPGALRAAVQNHSFDLAVDCAAHHCQDLQKDYELLKKGYIQSK